MFGCIFLGWDQTKSFSGAAFFFKEVATLLKNVQKREAISFELVVKRSPITEIDKYSSSYIAGVFGKYGFCLIFADSAKIFEKIFFAKPR